MSYETKQTKARPDIVTFYSVLLWIIALISGILELLGLAGFDIYPERTDTVQKSILLVTTGLLSLLIGIGLWRVKKWGVILLVFCLGAYKLYSGIFSNQDSGIFREIIEILIVASVSFHLWRTVVAFNKE